MITSIFFLFFRAHRNGTNWRIYTSRKFYLRWLHLLSRIYRLVRIFSLLFNIKRFPSFYSSIWDLVSNREHSPISLYSTTYPIVSDLLQRCDGLLYPYSHHSWISLFVFYVADLFLINFFVLMHAQKCLISHLMYSSIFARFHLKFGRYLSLNMVVKFCSLSDSQFETTGQVGTDIYTSLKSLWCVLQMQICGDA